MLLSFGMSLNRFLFVRLTPGGPRGPEGSGDGVGVASGAALLATPAITPRIWVLASFTMVLTVGEVLMGVGLGLGGGCRGGGGGGSFGRAPAPAPTPAPAPAPGVWDGLGLGLGYPFLAFPGLVPAARWEKAILRSPFSILIENCLKCFIEFLYNVDNKKSILSSSLNNEGIGLSIGLPIGLS